MENVRPLRIVPYNPDDYSLATALLEKQHEDETNPNELAAALSLAFQWPEHTHSVVVSKISQVANPKAVISYDTDERSPTELWVQVFETDSSAKFAEHDSVNIRLEIFRRCFEFHSNILSVTHAENSLSTHLIIEVPAALRIYKNRQLPRIRIDETSRSRLPDCVLALDNGERSDIRLEIEEIGLHSMRFRADRFEIRKDFSVFLGASLIPVRHVRSDDQGIAVAFILDDSNSFGNVFDVYRKVAYPFLRSRSEVLSSDVMNLYDETRYFSKFEDPSEQAERTKSIPEVWEALNSRQHLSTADYVMLNETGEVTGASSVTAAFHENEKPLWVFHQLCSKTNPSLLSQSGQLYTWRAEYLAARSEDLQVLGWFDSRSRWLERIYVKFAFHKYKSECIFPVALMKKTFHLEPDIAAQAVANVRTTNFGIFDRTFANIGGVLCGYGPKLLNASCALDAIVDLSKLGDHSKIRQIANSIMQKLDISTIEMEVTRLTQASNTESDGRPVGSVDRLFIFEKKGLIDFISSVEHAVAVTHRKKMRQSEDESA